MSIYCCVSNTSWVSHYLFTVSIEHFDTIPCKLFVGKEILKSLEKPFRKNKNIQLGKKIKIKNKITHLCPYPPPFPCNLPPPSSSFFPTLSLDRCPLFNKPWESWACSSRSHPQWLFLPEVREDLFLLESLINHSSSECGKPQPYCYYWCWYLIFISSPW